MTTKYTDFAYYDGGNLTRILVHHEHEQNVWVSMSAIPPKLFPDSLNLFLVVGSAIKVIKYVVFIRERLQIMF